MSAQIHVVATLTPREGKADRLVELLQEVSEYVKAKEPTTTRYEITRYNNEATKQVEIVMLETYENKAALDLHVKSEPYKALQKKVPEEELVTAAPKVNVLLPAGGFESRL